MKSKKDKISIAIVDHNQIFRIGIGMLSESAGFAIFGIYKDGNELIEAIGLERCPDFVFTTIEMRGMNGYEITLWIKNNYPSIKVLALCMNNYEKDVRKMVQNGAKGFIYKTLEKAEIRTAVKSVNKYGYYYSFAHPDFIESLKAIR